MAEEVVHLFGIGFACRGLHNFPNKKTHEFVFARAEIFGLFWVICDQCVNQGLDGTCVRNLLELMLLNVIARRIGLFHPQRRKDLFCNLA